MHQYLLTLDIKMLEALYIKQTDALKLRLLGGACWKDVAKQRNKITAIALAIHEKQGLPTKGIVFGETNI
jgi:hypothetical protein